MLEPYGSGAARIAELWWALLWLGVAVYAVVLGLLLRVVARRGRAPAAAVRTDQEPERHPATARWLTIAGLTIPAIILAIVFVVTLRTAAQLERHASPAVTVRVTGWQWWWEVRYLTAGGRMDFTTANELHLPLGRPVRLELTAGDVIHSLWVPSLNGKLDLVPGRTTVLWLDAMRPGVFRGECAEFCGLQHTRMGLSVVSHEPREFESWRDRQRVAADSAPPTLVAGRAVFARACAYCHGVRGANAAAQPAPDLTHLQSRRSIAAGTLPNTRENLAAWISDPQRVKPGAKMPRLPLLPAEMQPLLDYLASLR